MQSVYAPLSQYFSDSDSEKEIIMEQVFTTNWTTNNVLTNINTKNMIPHEYQMNNNINQNKVKTKRVRFAMSPSRKVAFVTSIIFCFLPVIIFLWVVPCNISAVCPVKISTWKNAQKFMEFTGRINVIEGSFHEQNLALMYKGSFSDPKLEKNGVLAFSGRSGSVLWNFEQETCPLKMNCSMLDVDQDGYKDCLILDQTGLKAINTLSGTLIWHFHSLQKSSLNPEGLDFPVLLNDIDNDGTTDLLLLTKKEKFLVVSGQIGNALCNITILPCLYMEDLEAVDKNVKFRCIFENDKIYYQISFNDITMKCKNMDKNISLNYVEQKNYTEDESIYQSGKEKLSVNVYGQCPNCRSSVELFYKKEVVNRSWKYEHALVSAPVPFYLDYTRDPLVNGHINGFIFKIWQWQNNSEELTSSTEVHQRPVAVNNTKYHLYPVIESVVLLSFYKNVSHDINVSMSEIFIICKNQDLNDCQPDYRNRQYSLEIADLDRDNSLELIRYYSSYQKDEKNGNDNWNLISELTVFRLAKELPKLYKSKK